MSILNQEAICPHCKNKGMTIVQEAIFTPAGIPTPNYITLLICIHCKAPISIVPWSGQIPTPISFD